jgi:hypothetical protein
LKTSSNKLSLKMPPGYFFSHLIAQLASESTASAPLSPRISFNACSHKTSGLRSPASARAMILSAMACLTPSSQSPIRRAMHVVSNATPRMRVVSRSNLRPFKKGLMGMDHSTRRSYRR